MWKLLLPCLVFANFFTARTAHAQFWNYVKVFYIYTSNNVSGEEKLFSINVNKEIVEGRNLEFFTHLKNTSEEFDITAFQLDILQCAGDRCTVRASIFSPKFGNVSSHETYSRKDHKKFSLTVEDNAGSTMTVMSATEWKKYAERHQINLEIKDPVADPESCGNKDFCYQDKR